MLSKCYRQQGPHSLLIVEVEGTDETVIAEGVVKAPHDDVGARVAWDANPDHEPYLPQEAHDLSTALEHLADNADAINAHH